jgi:hypothetical protein
VFQTSTKVEHVAAAEATFASTLLRGRAISDISAHVDIGYQNMLTRWNWMYSVTSLVRLFTAKDLAFVQFRWRASAEFAKEAMSQQTLDNGNIVSVRWAREDPNPRAVAAAAAERAHYAARAVAEAVSFTSRETQLPATSSYGGTGTIGDEKLPSGWTAYFHAVYQRPYYVHVSGITQWEYPVPASALVVADNQIRETEAVSASHSSRDVDTRDENPLALLAAYASSDEDVAEKRHEQKKDAKSTQALQNDGNGESVGSSDDSKRRKVSLESSS